MLSFLFYFNERETDEDRQEERKQTFTEFSKDDGREGEHVYTHTHTHRVRYTLTFSFLSYLSSVKGQWEKGQQQQHQRRQQQQKKEGHTGQHAEILKLNFLFNEAY